MFIGYARFDFLVPGSDSLKDKRRIVRRVVERMRARFHVSVAEVDHLDLLQRSAVGVSCVSNSHSHARQMLDELERFVRSEPEIEMVEVLRDVVAADA